MCVIQHFQAAVHFPLSSAAATWIIFPLKFFGNAGNQTRGYKFANSALSSTSPLPHYLLLYLFFSSFRMNELEGQIECLDDVDPEVFNEYKDLKASLAILVSGF